MPKPPKQDRDMGDPGGSLMDNAKAMGKALLNRGKDYDKFSGKAPKSMKKKKSKGGM